MKTTLQKTILAASILAVFGFVGAKAAAASTVNRSFSSPNPVAGSTLTVSLAVDVTVPDSFYIIDEVFPTGWTVSNPGSGDTTQAGHIKWAVITGATSTTLNYDIDVPAAAAGINVFSGEFALDSTPIPVPILGQTEVNVSAPVATLSSIAVTTPANKTTYTVGDALDIAGLVVTGTYSDATTKVETVTVADITGFDSSAPATGQVLTITIGGKTTTYTVDINAAPPIADTTAPVITLNGTSPVNVVQGSAYSDAGATATDNVDGAVAVTTSGTVDTNVIGQYILTYSATDAAGNQATPVTRTVNVVAAPPIAPQKLDLEKLDVTSVTSNSITLLVKTSTDSKVQFFLSTNRKNILKNKKNVAKGSDGVEGTEHTIVLSGLKKNKNYYWKLAIQKPDGSESFETQMFRTKTLKKDLKGANLSISDPSSGATINEDLLKVLSIESVTNDTITLRVKTSGDTNAEVLMSKNRTSVKKNKSNIAHASDNEVADEHTIVLSGLKNNKNHYWKLVIQNPDGSEKFETEIFRTKTLK